MQSASVGKRQKDDRASYVKWQQEGLIDFSGLDVVDHDAVRKKINELGKVYNIEEIAVDRWDASQIIQQLDGDGFGMVTFGQGFQSMSAPSKELERLVLANDLLHAGHPVLRWMLSNTVIDTDAAECIKPTKKKSTGRIDGTVALIMAIGRMIANATSKESVYKKRGLRVL